jgi:hypothetical protein
MIVGEEATSGLMQIHCLGKGEVGKFSDSPAVARSNDRPDGCRPSQFGLTIGVVVGTTGVMAGVETAGVEGA